MEFLGLTVSLMLTSGQPNQLEQTGRILIFFSCAVLSWQVSAECLAGWSYFNSSCWAVVRTGDGCGGGTVASLHSPGEAGLVSGLARAAGAGQGAWLQLGASLHNRRLQWEDGSRVDWLGLLLVDPN